MSDPAGPTRRAARRGPALAMAVMAGGGGLAVLAGRPAWDSVRVDRSAPLPGFTVGVAGHTLEPAVTGLGLVALAAVVAVLATRGSARRVIGAVVLVAGGLLAWRSAAGFSAVSAGRARALVGQARPGSALDAAATVQVRVHPLWPALALVAGGLIMISGVLVALRAGQWGGLGARYDSPADSGATRAAPAEPASSASTDLALWQRLDRGEDPTAPG